MISIGPPDCRRPQLTGSLMRDLNKQQQKGTPNCQLGRSAALRARETAHLLLCPVKVAGRSNNNDKMRCCCCLELCRDLPAL
jgi:hypothetical protein